MNLRQLQQLIALAETGNFHRAAERLHMAQPPLSVSIRKLEDELGGALFVRTPTGVHVTAAGQAMLTHARLAVFHATQCGAVGAEALAGEAGALRIGFIGTATHVLLPRLIQSFRAEHPQVDLDLTETTTHDALDDLEARRLDVGLVRWPVLHTGPFELHVLEDDEFVLAVPTGSRWARRARTALSALRDEPFIMYSHGRSPSLHAVALLRCQHSGFVPRVAQEALQVQTILSLVASGLGVALVASVARHHSRPDVKFLRLTDNPPDFPLGIAMATLAGATDPIVERFTRHALHQRRMATGNATDR